MGKDPSLKITKLIPDWIKRLEDTNQGDYKERTSRANKLREFVREVGDLRVQDIKKQHAYQNAKWLNDEGKANKTIRALITRVSEFLTWCEQTGLIEESPFINLKLSFR